MQQLLNRASAGGAFIAIPVSAILAGKPTDFSLYLREAADETVRLYRDANYPIEPDDVRHLIERGVSSLYVAASDGERYRQHVRRNLAQTICDESIPVGQRIGCVNEVLRDVLAEVFSRSDIDRTVESTKELACHTVELICRSDVIARDLFQVLYHDYHTFTHSTNVSVYCVLLAKSIGIQDEEDLRQIAAGALLHDLGKLAVPAAILNKAGRLSKAEFEVVKQHPTSGFATLGRRDDLNFGQLMMVYQHHERLDGSGYPVGVVGDEIHPWAQICAVADVYEALTSNRPYRRALSKCQALRIMARKSGRDFNREMLRCWQTVTMSN